MSVKCLTCKKYVWNPGMWSCKNGKYLASIMDTIISDEIIDVKETSFDKKNNL